MTVLEPTVPAGVLCRRQRLSPGPAGVGQARARVRAAVRDWRLPVSEGMAVLLTWDLVTSVTTEGPGGANGTEGPAGPRVPPAGGGPAAGGFLSLGISAWRGMLRVDVYDGRRSLPARGYQIVASLADDWGSYRTPAGRAVFFTLCFLGDAHQSPWPGAAPNRPPGEQPASGRLGDSVPLSPPGPGLVQPPAPAPGRPPALQRNAGVPAASRLIADNTSAD